MFNFPDTIQLGDVRNVQVKEPIWLLAGGSPCQSFSFAGKMNGMSAQKQTIEITCLEQYLELKKSNFEFDGQSYLFWEYVRVLKGVKPKYFLLENVVMAKKWENIITKTLGVSPIRINSNLVSAQNRDRLYWTNIGHEPGGLFGEMTCSIQQPKDRKIFLNDILENEVDEKYYLKNKKIATQVREKIKNMNAGFLKVDINGNLKKDQSKASCFTAGGNSAGNHSDMDVLCFAVRGRDGVQVPEFNGTNKSNCITSVGKDNYVTNSTILRRFTPKEVCRLQTIPDNYFFDGGKQIISDSAIYKAVGNAWTVDVILDILSYLPEE
jgi:DNA (cytosine-5)-methyltransferase 3A